MKKAKLLKFKEILLEQKREILQTVGKTIENNLLKNPTEEKPDYVDMSMVSADRDFILRLRERERKLLLKIEKSLLKIKNATYGICEQCGDEIGEKRLEARPVATLCIECKTKQEELEKQGA